MAKRLWDKGENLNTQVQHFTVGTDPIGDLELIQWDVAASAAHAQMLKSINILSGEELDQVITSLGKVLSASQEGNFTIPIELEDCHTAIENFLVEDVGEVGKKIHTGRSRNDQVLVATRLYLRDALCKILKLSTELAGCFTQRAEQSMDIPMPGHTHMQRAMPTTYGIWFHAFAEMLTVNIFQGIALLENINCNPLGAASGFGVPLALDRDMTSRLLGFSKTQRNPIAIISSRGHFELQSINFCKDLLFAVEKFAFDTVLFCTEEYGLISLPSDFTTGSSIMPQKRNPDVAELLRAKVAGVRAAACELEMIIAKLPSNYHRDHQLCKAPLFRAINSTLELLSICCALVNAIEINPNRAKQALTDDLLATYEAYRLVAQGSSFRDAYKQAATNYKEGKLDRDELLKDLKSVTKNSLKELAVCKKELKTAEEEIVSSEKAFFSAINGILNT